MEVPLVTLRAIGPGSAEAVEGVFERHRDAAANHPDKAYTRTSHQLVLQRRSLSLRPPSATKLAEPCPTNESAADNICRRGSRQPATRCARHCSLPVPAALIATFEAGRLGARNSGRDSVEHTREAKVEALVWARVLGIENAAGELRVRTTGEDVAAVRSDAGLPLRLGQAGSTPRRSNSARGRLPPASSGAFEVLLNAVAPDATGHALAPAHG